MKVDVIDWFLNGQVTDQDVATKFKSLQTSASSRGIEFLLTLDKVKRLLQTKRCAYTGITFVPDPQQPTSKTIDRVDNNEGYTDENTVACCLLFNSMKGSMTIPQITALYKGVTRHQEKRKQKAKLALKKSAIAKARKKIKAA